MFFMAVSPWHIVNSRWAVESNIMPFLFLAGFTALLARVRETFDVAPTADRSPKAPTCFGMYLGGTWYEPVST